MRTALARRTQPKAAQRPNGLAQVAFMPAPTQGWDTETPVAELPQTRARVLDNFIPQGQSIAVRKGISTHVTGLGAKIESLMAYNAAGPVALFGAAGTSVYNVTSAGAVGAAVLTSMGNARFSYVNFVTSGGSYLWICNGSADPRHWNGLAWAVPALTMTTFTDNNIKYVWESKQRLFFCFVNSLTFGYLATVDAVAGTVNNYSLGSVFTMGGQLIAGFKLSRDSGDGLDDLTGFLTSEGEFVIYEGTDPSSSTTWSRIGTFYAGEPVGDRPIVELGGDIGIITTSGLVSVRAVMLGALNSGDPVQVTAAYLTAQVSTPWREYVADGQALSGWEGLYFGGEGLVILNVPTDATTSIQIVRHQATGSPSRFTGWDFTTFEVYNGFLYGGGIDGTVYLCFDGFADVTSDVEAKHSSSWTQLGVATLKTLQEARPVLTTSTRAALRLIARTDFRGSPALASWPVATITNALIWGEGNWGEKIWGGENGATRQWRAISGEGHHIQIVTEVRSNQTEYVLNGYNVTFTTGAAR